MISTLTSKNILEKVLQLFKLGVLNGYFQQTPKNWLNFNIFFKKFFAKNMQGICPGRKFNLFSGQKIHYQTNGHLILFNSIFLYMKVLKILSNDRLCPGIKSFVDNGFKKP